MPSYLFTSDLRISDLENRIRNVASYIQNGGIVSNLKDKSENNNATTLVYYFNLYNDTQVCEISQNDPIFAIRNFILKFQFPNTRTKFSFNESINQKLLLAPYRAVISILMRMAENSITGDSYITLDEISYFVFCNASVYLDPAFNIDAVIKSIEENRNSGSNFSGKIQNLLNWKQYQRQVREMFIVLTIGYKCFKPNKDTITFNVNSNEYNQDRNEIDKILSYSFMWFPSDISNFTKSEIEYKKYMDTIDSSYSVIDYNKRKQIVNNQSFNMLNKTYNPLISALRTKPFLLLAGISGTGKSQKVQELAFMSCPDGDLRNENKTTPGNYCLIEVKPNWHDSTELLGYYSALSGRYELTDFIRFVYKALTNKEVPFFLCLDEMNLAPVEQYFAEFLSVLETRKRIGDGIKTQPLLTRDKFSNCELEKKTLVKDDGNFFEEGKHYNMEFLYSENDSEIIRYLKENGLQLPDNLFVIGTVNMDDTTHQFSRKVIDRAFTIEMNGGKMEDMFSDENRYILDYLEEPLPLSVFKSEFVKAYEVLEDPRFAKYEETIKERIPALLGNSDGTADDDSINGVLNGTPFRVSYRVQNELVLYLSVLIENAKYPDDIEPLIGEATLAILMEKILPRIQGEQKQLETKGGKSNILKDMKAFVQTHFAPSAETESELYERVIKKLDEMDRKLSGYYTNFF